MPRPDVYEPVALPAAALAAVGVLLREVRGGDDAVGELGQVAAAFWNMKSIDILFFSQTKFKF